MLDWADSGFVSVGGKKHEYACFGPPPGDAPTIIMLHEGLGCTALWRDVPQQIADATGLSVFVYSRAGYGQSDVADLPRPLDYMTVEATEVLPHIIDALGVSRCVLLGHSDGATIAAEYAGRIEDFRVRGLILIAPHFFTEPEGLASIAEAKAAYDAGDLQKRMAKYHRDPDAAFRGWNNAWLDPGFKDWNVSEVIDYWRIPCLAIQGEQDQYGSRAQIDEIETRSYAPVDVAMIAGAAHAPHLEQPGPTLAAIKDFCAHLETMEAAAPEGI